MTAAITLPPVAQTAPQLYCQLVTLGLGEHELARIRNACQLAVHQTGDLLRGSGKPFSCHVVGVGSLVAEATSDVDSVVAALLHALVQQRVSFTADGEDRTCGESRRAQALTAFGERVTALLHAYQQAAPLSVDAATVDADLPLARQVRILQLADMLEDGLDGGPWWHGAADDSGDEPGSAGQRCRQIQALAPLFAQAPSIGAPNLLARFDALMEAWDRGVWPSCLRTGQYSSFTPRRMGEG